MSVLSKICGITIGRIEKNVEMLKELSVEKEIVDFVLQVRMLTYFGHVNRVGKDRFPKLLLHYYCMVTHMDIGREEDQKINGWTVRT